jgi:hypothetical protein
VKGLARRPPGLPLWPGLELRWPEGLKLLFRGGLAIPCFCPYCQGFSRHAKRSTTSASRKGRPGVAVGIEPEDFNLRSARFFRTTPANRLRSETESF